MKISQEFCGTSSYFKIFFISFFLIWNKEDSRKILRTKKSKQSCHCVVKKKIGSKLSLLFFCCLFLKWKNFHTRLPKNYFFFIILRKYIFLHFSKKLVTWSGRNFRASYKSVLFIDLEYTPKEYSKREKNTTQRNFDSFVRVCRALTWHKLILVDKRTQNECKRIFIANAWRWLIRSVRMSCFKSEYYSLTIRLFCSKRWR